VGDTLSILREARMYTDTDVAIGSGGGSGPPMQCVHAGVGAVVQHPDAGDSSAAGWNSEFIRAHAQDWRRQAGLVGHLEAFAPLHR